MPYCRSPEEALSAQPLIVRLAEKLMAKGLLLATAESCTGGLVSALCTDIPGSSRWFAGGVVAYANEVKTRLLGVPEATLARHGAVSAETVLAMAEGAMKNLRAQCAVALSGIAGPDGGTPGKPVGTVWIGLAVQDEGGGPRLNAVRRFFNGSRHDIRWAAALEALRALEALLT